MSDFDREEAAFRTALERHSADAPTHLPEGDARPRRPWWIVSAAAAAVVVAAVVIVPFVVRGGADRPASSEPTSSSTAPNGSWQWISYRDIEVKAPAGWPPAVEPLKPECIFDDLTGPAASDVPRTPYVSVGDPDRPMTASLCVRLPQPGDPPAPVAVPDPAFGALPFPLWQPYVKLAAAMPDLKAENRKDGQWQFRGWSSRARESARFRSRSWPRQRTHPWDPWCFRRCAPSM